MVNSELSKSQQAVQAGHCLAQHLIDHKNTKWTNGTLVYLKIDSEKKLQLFYDYLFREDIESSFFREPDRNNEMTAISCFGHSELFKNLRLL